MRAANVLGILLLVLVSTDAVAGSSLEDASTPVYGFRVVGSYPHDPEAFTQGLVYHHGFLFESTGRESELRKLRLDTGEVVRRKELAEEYFGEGLALWRDRLIQLTWKANTGLVYDVATFTRRETFSYAGEGWGLTHDGAHLIMSDGSSELRFLDPETYEERQRVRVMDGSVPIDNLNELEYVGDEVYANVYRTDRIARIAPDTGQVVGWIDLAELTETVDGAGVLNGIAHDPQSGRLFVTGKLWPRLFAIELVRRRE